VEQEPKHKPLSLVDLFKQLKDRLRRMLEDHNQLALQAGQRVGSPEFQGQLAVSQVKANLAAELLDMIENPERERPVEEFPDPEKSGELAEEGNSW